MVVGKYYRRGLVLESGSPKDTYWGILKYLRGEAALILAVTPKNGTDTSLLLGNIGIYIEYTKTNIFINLSSEDEKNVTDLESKLKNFIHKKRDVVIT